MLSASLIIGCFIAFCLFDHLVGSRMDIAKRKQQFGMVIYLCLFINFIMHLFMYLFILKDVDIISLTLSLITF